LLIRKSIATPESPYTPATSMLRRWRRTEAHGGAEGVWSGFGADAPAGPAARSGVDCAGDALVAERTNDAMKAAYLPRVWTEGVFERLEDGWRQVAGGQGAAQGEDLPVGALGFFLFELDVISRWRRLNWYLRRRGQSVTLVSASRPPAGVVATWRRDLQRKRRSRLALALSTGRVYGYYQDSPKAQAWP
jgi:aspartate aminotransferase-like enzyme